ncbi:D-dopachrome decarboxylase-like [Glandiceps talaboti]
MPLCTITTSLPDEKFSDEFLKETSALIAKILDKPEERVQVTLLSNKRIILSGSFEPSLTFYLSSFEKFRPADKNQEYSKEIFQFLSEKTGLACGRMRVIFHDLPKVDVGFPPTQ